MDISNTQMSKQIYTQFQLNLTEVRKDNYNNVYNNISINSKVFEQGKLSIEKRMIMEDGEIYKFVEFIDLLFSGNQVNPLKLMVKIYNTDIKKYENMPLMATPDMNSGTVWFTIGALMIMSLNADDLRILKLKLNSYFQDYLKFTTNQIMISLLENIENKLDENSKNEIHHLNMFKSQISDAIENISITNNETNNKPQNNQNTFHEPEVKSPEYNIENQNPIISSVGGYKVTDSSDLIPKEELTDTINNETNKEMNTETSNNDINQPENLDNIIQQNQQILGNDDNILNLNELGDSDKLENTKIDKMDQIDPSLLSDENGGDEKDEEPSQLKNEIYDNKNVQDIFLKEFPNYKKLMSKLYMIAQEPNSQYKFIHDIVYKTYITQMAKPNYTFNEFCEDVFGLNEIMIKNKLYQSDYKYHDQYTKQMDDILNKKPEEFINEFILNINMVQNPVLAITKNIGSPIIFDTEDKKDEIGNRTFKLLDHPAFKQLHNLSKMILSIMNYQYGLLYSLLRNEEIDQKYLQEIFYQDKIENIDKIRIGLIMNILSIIKTTSSFVYLTVPPKFDTLIANNGIIQLDKDYSRLTDMLNYRNDLMNNGFFHLENSYIMDDFKYFIGHTFKFDLTKDKMDSLYNINYIEFLNDRFLESYYIYFQMDGINNMYKHIYKNNKNDILKDALLDKLNNSKLNEENQTDLIKLSEFVINYQDFMNHIDNKPYKNDIPEDIYHIMKIWDSSFINDKTHFYSLLNEKFDSKNFNITGVSSTPDYKFA
jgi:hypothetical protein